MNRSIMNRNFIIRQLTRSSKQATVFVLCVVLSLITLTALNGFSKSVNRALLADARKLHAADIIIRSHEPISTRLEKALADLVEQKRVQSTRYHQFYSVVRTVDDRSSVLASLKVVQQGYPFYGEVVLRSGKPFSQVLSSGNVIVAQSLMDRLGIRVGDPLKVGYAVLTIQDVVMSEPDRPVNLFSFGPRVFISVSDLKAISLVETGSHIHRVQLIKVEEGTQPEVLAEQLQKAAHPDNERVETFRTAESGVKRFLDNFLFFLKLLGIFILIVAGFGIQGTLTAFLGEKEHTIAIMKTVGATNRYITHHFIIILLIMGSIGILVGLVAGYAVQNALAWLLASYLPKDLVLGISWAGLSEGVILGILVVGVFAFLPLWRLKDLRPVMIFRNEPAGRRSKWPYYASGAMLLSLVFFLVFWHMQDVRMGLYFVLGVSGIILLSALITRVILKGLIQWPARRLSIRQAVRGLFRQGNATRSVVITLAASLCVIFSIFLIGQNLDHTFVQSFPPDSPNLFFVDVQPDQKEPVSETVNQKLEFYPIVRARVTAINGRPVDRRKETRKRRDNLGRMFNLTYRSHLLPDETIVAGDSLFRQDREETQVSIMDSVVKMAEMKVGDRITFKIQGVPLKARIASIRSREKESFNPFFYFVFQARTLKEAPHTLFAAMKAGKDEIAPLQNRVVSRFPNISVIDISAAIRTFARLMRQLSNIISVFSLFSVVAGVLILVSAVLATRNERILESVYYKILGAPRSFVLRVFTLENIAIGLLSSLIALVMSQAGTWLLCRYAFEIPYRPFLLSFAGIIAATVLLVVVIGLIASWSILTKKPVTYLREQPDV